MQITTKVQKQIKNTAAQLKLQPRLWESCIESAEKLDTLLTADRCTTAPNLNFFISPACSIRYKSRSWIKAEKAFDAQQICCGEPNNKQGKKGGSTDNLYIKNTFSAKQLTIVHTQSTSSS